MDDERWARLEAKRKQNHYFLGLETAAMESQTNPKKIKAAKPKKERVLAPLKDCRSCGKTMRRYNQLLEDAPGTVAPGARGLCNSCSATSRIGSRTTRPETCKDCGWKLRERGTDADNPGTRRHHGRGLCHTCAHREANGSPKRFVRPESCRGCGWKLRPGGTKVADWPGTRRHHGQGLCQQCFYQDSRSGRRMPERTRHDGTTFCQRCKVQLRSTMMGPEELPNAKPVGKRVPGGHICSTCATRERRYGADADYAPRRFPRPETCTDCGAKLRASGESAVDKPGTKRHQGGGLCSGCWEKVHRGVGAR